jgi:hypothetical protein
MIRLIIIVLLISSCSHVEKRRVFPNGTVFMMAKEQQ